MRSMAASPAWSQVGPCQWTGLDWSAGWIVNDPLDPYLVWADATHAVDYGWSNDKWIPILIEFKAVDQVHEWVKAVRRAGYDDSVLRVPNIFGNPGRPWKLVKETKFATAQFKPAFFGSLIGTPSLWDPVARIQIGLPMKTDVKDVPFTPVPQSILRAPVTAVVGVIDDGMAFSNATIRGRLGFFWNQDKSAQDRPERPVGFNYGAELGPRNPSKCLIETWEDDATHAATRQLDEEAVYQAAQMMQLRRRVTHGSAVMDIAARSTRRRASNDPNAAVVCVQLPAHLTADTAAAAHSPVVLDAMHYILARADDITRSQGPLVQPLPVVVNLSYGDIAGPHDGHSMLEAAIDDLVSACARLARPQRIGIVIPSGNFQLSRCHANFALEPRPTPQVPTQHEKTLTWRVHPDDRTPSFMEIWLPPDFVNPPGNASVTVSVTPPGGTAGHAVGIGSAYAWAEAGRSPLCTIVFPAKPVNGVQPGRQRLMILLAIAPTGALEPRDLAPSGNWKVTVSSPTAINGNVDAWIQRDDSAFGYPRRGRQSCFDDPNYVRYTANGFIAEDDTVTGFPGQNPAQAYVKRAGTLNGISTGNKTIVVGGYRAASPGKPPARYSSSGPPDPLLAQASEHSDAHHGVLAGGTHSGSTTPFNGTSIAAPQVTDELAFILAAGSVTATLDHVAATSSARLTGSAAPPAGTVTKGVLVPGIAPARIDPRLGYGRLAPQNRVGRAFRREVDKP
jgi:hypothetical protein